MILLAALALALSMASTLCLELNPEETLLLDFLLFLERLR